MDIERLLEECKEIHARKQMHLPALLRPYFQGIQTAHRGVLIWGPRGVGKTTFLLSRIQENGFFYLSADHPMIASTSLWEIGKAAFAQGYEGVMIDEVHHAKDWSLHLKALYDAYPQKHLWVSDSSSVILRKGIADLSRRFSRIPIPLMSFREYLLLRENITLPRIENIFQPDPDTVRECLSFRPLLQRFREYMQGGFRPIFLEWDYSEQILHILEKTLHTDIPFFVPQISPNHFQLMNSIVGYLAQSVVPTVNIEKLCKEWGLGKEKLYSLLEAMELTGIIHIVKKEGKQRLYTKGEKILFQDPALYSILSDNLGTQREAFVVFSFLRSGRSITACPDEQQGDFVVEGRFLEVGGMGKKRKAADFVIRDDTEIPSGPSIPLWMLGCMS